MKLFSTWFSAYIWMAVLCITFMGCTGEDLYVPQADLVVNSVKLSTSSVQLGQSVTVTSVVKNEGGITASAHKVSYYISQDDNYDIGTTIDVELGSFDVSALASNEEVSHTTTFTLQSFNFIGYGPNYILCVIDPDSVITESDEENNVAAASLEVYLLVNTFPYTENFETFLLCSEYCGIVCILSNGWRNDVGTNADWIVNYGGTFSSYTGPSSDYDPGTSFGNYLYVEASDSCYSNVQAFLYSPFLDFTSLASPKLDFAYHMYGQYMGSLSVQVSGNGGNTWSTNLWSLSGNQTDNWYTAGSINLSAYGGNPLVQIRFRGITGSSYESDMAIDYVRVYQ